MIELFEEDSSDENETAWAVMLQIGTKMRGRDTHAVLGYLVVVQGSQRRLKSRPHKDEADEERRCRILKEPPQSEGALVMNGR